MVNDPLFASIGNETGKIDVRLSYRIVELFSEGLYSSPNKAIEELVANSFDAGALSVQVILSRNLHAQDATIAVIDNGQGMDAAGLKQHWLIGISNKRGLPSLPRGRQQIGKFGIGKLATYVLCNRLTHISKNGGKYYSTSMDYLRIDRRVDGDVEPRSPLSIGLRELTVDEAKMAVNPWIETGAFKASKMELFGKYSPKSWTISILSDLKDKVHDIKPGILRWVLSTALPLRPDFNIWLNGENLVPSKEGKGLIESWVIGEDFVELPRPCPKDVTDDEDEHSKSEELRFGLNVPGIGRVTGYAEAYEDLLTGKSDEIGRSYGFFVYVYGRLLNVADGHFGIPPDELRHGTFGRFRLVVHMDGLDAELRSNRESIADGPLLEAAQNLLRSIFNAVRPTIETHIQNEEPGAKLARKLAASPTSLSRRPIVELSRAVADGKAKAHYLIVPVHESDEERETFLADLEKRSHNPEQFVTGTTIDQDGSAHEGFVKFDAENGLLRLNAWHPFVGAFNDEFSNRRFGLPLELFAMAEVLTEAHLHMIGVQPANIDEFLSSRDQLLRHLANESGRQSSLSIANALLDARNNRDELEEAVCAAFHSLGFDVTPLGKSGRPDGVAAANLPADEPGKPRHYRVSLEAKSKLVEGKVAAKDADISAVKRNRDKYNCDHAIIVGPSFPTSAGYSSALGQSIKDDRCATEALGTPRTITLITVDDLARLVRLRPVKRVGLQKLRELFYKCSLPEESAGWVDDIRQSTVELPPYRNIVETIEKLQADFKMEAVTYSALRVELSHLEQPITYETNASLADLSKAMSQMAPGSIFATADKVELDQSAANVITALEAAIQDYPQDER